MAELVIALFVSSVTGHHVTRFGTGTLIGAVVDLEHPGNLRWDEDKIVAIPDAEYQAHKREYDVLLADGALKKRTAEEYAAYVKATADAIEAAAKPAPAQAAETKPPAPETKGSATETIPAPEAAHAEATEPAHEAEEHV